MTEEVSELRSLKGILDRVQLWTAAADQKTEVLTAIETLALGFLLGVEVGVVQAPRRHERGPEGRGCG